MVSLGAATLSLTFASGARADAATVDAAKSEPEPPKSELEPVFTSAARPAWYWLGGIAAGATTVAADRGGFLGGEVSAVRASNGRPYGGPYVDASYDFGARRTYATGGGDLGYRFVGLGAGGAARIGGSRIEWGAAARLSLTFGLVSIYGRYEYFVDALRQDDAHVVQIGALVRVPLARWGMD